MPKPKKQHRTSIAFYAKTWEDMETLMEAWGCNRTQVVERLVSREMERRNEERIKEQLLEESRVRYERETALKAGGE